MSYPPDNPASVLDVRRCVNYLLLMRNGSARAARAARSRRRSARPRQAALVAACTPSRLGALPAVGTWRLLQDAPDLGRQAPVLLGVLLSHTGQVGYGPLDPLHG